VLTEKLSWQFPPPPFSNTEEKNISDKLFERIGYFIHYVELWGPKSIETGKEVRTFPGVREKIPELLSSRE
jgi:hypothetical protein